MNETLKTILNRRSIRSFADQQIEHSDLQAVIEAAKYAPSGGGTQPWFFSVIQRKELIEELSSASKEVAKNHEVSFLRELANKTEFNTFYNAPTVIVISGVEKNVWSSADCAAAAQNILLAAESLGLGGCWVNFGLFVFGSEKGVHYKELLNVPEGFKPFYSVALGYKKGDAPAAAPRKEQTISYIK
ncbi:MAG: nitroreductase family protein [Negativicutes bacterium]|nr:nitroreductase family protein [Negativicutes bacterium]